MRTGTTTYSAGQQRKRSLVGACLATLALILNIILPAAWSQAAPISTPFGGSFSICMADGGQTGSVDVSSEQSPDETGATALHCSVCLFGCGAVAPSSPSNVTETVFRPTHIVSYHYTEPTLGSLRHALTSEARAPPA